MSGFSLILFTGLSFVVYIYDNYMFAWETQIRWGHSRFDSEKFRKVSTNEKSEMIADLVKKKYFIGEPISSVAKALGDRTGGYYNDELNLTYTVYESGETTWEIVFIVNPNTKRVHSIRIYKSCCAITKRALIVIFRIIDRLF